jgi:hypothetical protein
VDDVRFLRHASSAPDGPHVAVSHALDNPVSSGDTAFDLSDIAELYALFMQVADPRRPRGVRHHIATVLTVMVLTVWLEPVTSAKPVTGPSICRHYSCERPAPAAIHALANHSHRADRRSGG